MRALVYNFHQVADVKPSTNRNLKFFFALDIMNRILVVTCIKLAKRKCFWNALNSYIFYFRFDGQSYQSAGSSEYSHPHTYGIANYRGKALVTGSSGYSAGSLKTELMDMHTLTWSSGYPDYPFTHR